MKIPWLTEEQYENMSLPERALHHAAFEYLTWGDRNLEVDGPNKGKRLKEYAKALGMSDGVPWCAIFIAWCFKQAGANVFPKHASACYWLLEQGVECEPKRGAIGGWCDKKRWRGHVFFVAEVRRKLGLTYVRTYEGNTNLVGSREGNSIRQRWRLVTKRMRFRWVNITW